MYEDLVEYKELLDSGALTQEEYDKLKAKTLGVKLPANAKKAPEKAKQAQQSAPAEKDKPAVPKQEPAREQRPAPEQKTAQELPVKESEGKSEELAEPAADMDGEAAVEEIMAYKALLDSGAISQSEFNRKKSQLLGVESDEDRALREAAEAEEKRAKRRAKNNKSLIIKCVCAFVVTTGIGFVMGMLTGYAPNALRIITIALGISLIEIVALVVLHRSRVKREE